MNCALEQCRDRAIASELWVIVQHDGSRFSLTTLRRHFVFATKLTGSDTFALAGSTLAQIEGKETIMKRLLPLSLALVLVSSCAVGLYHNNRNRTRVEAQPEFYGTVTYFDPVAHRIDLDYVENGTHQTRNVYYNTQATRWNGVRDNEVRTGDRIVVRGHQDKGRWQADEVRRHE
jgi:hypothetical protein